MGRQRRSRGQCSIQKRSRRSLRINRHQLWLSSCEGSAVHQPDQTCRDESFDGFAERYLSFVSSEKLPPGAKGCAAFRSTGRQRYDGQARTDLFFLREAN